MKRVYKNRVRWLGLFTRNFGHYCERQGKFAQYNNYSTVHFDVRIEITKVRDDYFRTRFSRDSTSVYIEYHYGEISEYSSWKTNIMVLKDLISVLRKNYG